MEKAEFEALLSEQINHDEDQILLIDLGPAGESRRAGDPFAGPSVHRDGRSMLCGIL